MPVNALGFAGGSLFDCQGSRRAVVYALLGDILVARGNFCPAILDGAVPLVVQREQLVAHQVALAVRLAEFTVNSDFHRYPPACSSRRSSMPVPLPRRIPAVATSWSGGCRFHRQVPLQASCGNRESA